MAIEAGPLAQFHLFVGSDLELPAEPSPIRARRRADGHHTADDIHQAPGCAAVGIGAEVARRGLVLFARVLDGREHIALRYGDERVGFVVLEVGVEVRGVLLDEVSLQHQALVLVGRHHVLEGMDLRYQKRDLGAVVLEVDVLAHAGAKLLRLANVDDLALLVLPKVHAGFGGNAGQLVLYPLKPFGIQGCYTFSCRSNSMSETLSRISFAWARVRLPDA